MKKVKNVILKDEKKLLIAILAIAIFMLLLSVVQIMISINEGIKFSFSPYSSILAVIPMAMGICSVMLLKTRKVKFGEIFHFASAVLIVLVCGLVLILGNMFGFFKDFLVFGVALTVLLAYPFIISGLTLRGCVYNRVFAILFAAILLVLSVGVVIVVPVLTGAFDCTLLVLPLMYVELILSVLCFELVPLSRKKNDDYIETI